MKKNTKKAVTEKITTTLGTETVFKGKMEFTKSLKIDGRFNGEIESTGYLYIEEGSNIKADIKVRSITVGGTIYGNVVASEKVVILSTGRVFGDISAAKLRLDDGVQLKGRCTMIRDPDSVDIFSGSVDKLKKTVKSV